MLNDNFEFQKYSSILYQCTQYSLIFNSIILIEKYENSTRKLECGNRHIMYLDISYAFYIAAKKSDLTHIFTFAK